MRIAITGGTGFLGRYIVRRLAAAGHELHCWRRPTSDVTGFGPEGSTVHWQIGALEHDASFEPLCRGADAVVHAALYRPGGLGFRSAGQQAFDEFVRVNLLGTLRLMQTAQQVGVPRFIFISTCAVHEIILPDRPLDETHPLWATSHYGAHKAAVEQFVHSYGFGMNWNVCALRPTGIYGVAHPVQDSRWYDIVARVVANEAIASDRGGKEVHAADVAKAVELLLHADSDIVRGQAYNCYDMYISEKHVAEIAREITGRDIEIGGHNDGPKNQIDTSKLGALGMTFGGESLLKATVASLADAVQRAS